MRVLIVGLGSIAKKHINALKQIDNTTIFYALRSGNNSEQVDDIINIKSISDCPEVDFVIISNPTALHAEAIKMVAHLKKPLFIEKPPFHNLENVTEILNIISKYNLKTYTAFNLRFLDCLIYLKENIEVKKVQEVNVYCGSYLPVWRDNWDYKKNYSANAAMGGGVHLDLIHELDYVLWIFGKPNEVEKILRSKSKIDVDAVDYANYTLVYDNFVVTIILNYYRRDTKRTCEIVMDTETWNVNLPKNEITNLNDNTIIYQSFQTPLNTYERQMDYFCKSLSSTQNISFETSLNESIKTLKIAL
jgi:predicted dehydrogenase